MVHNLTVTVEDDLWKDMKEHPEVRWGIVMKEAAKEKLRALIMLNKLVEKGKLTEEEIEKFALKLSRRIKS